MLENKITESYAKDGKKLSELVQEWIEENNVSLIYYKSEETNANK